MKKAVEINYSVMTFDDKPNTVGLVVKGAKPPSDQCGLVGYIKCLTRHMTPSMMDALTLCRHIGISVNNDPGRPDDELFVQYTLPFKVNERQIKIYVSAAEAFIQEYYRIHLIPGEMPSMN